MAKVIEREEAIHLRQKGESIKAIAKILGISKSTASIWCRDIQLTQEQIGKLHESMVRGSYAGRMKGASAQHERRINREKDAENIGVKEVGKMSKRDLLIALTALYWGEGGKKKREFFVINSDPEMIKFIFAALRKLFKIKNDRFILAIGINIIHKNREGEIKSYWSKITGIQEDQFRKTIFVKLKNKKKYKNFANYYGMLRVSIAKSSDIYYKIMGLIKGLILGA